MVWDIDKIRELAHNRAELLSNKQLGKFTANLYDGVSLPTLKMLVSKNNYESFTDALKRSGLNKYIRVTSNYRKPGLAGLAGNKSWHTKTDSHGNAYAFDITPVGISFELMEDLLETNPIMSKYLVNNNYRILRERKGWHGATGDHIHLVAFGMGNDGTLFKPGLERVWRSPKGNYTTGRSNNNPYIDSSGLYMDALGNVSLDPTAEYNNYLNTFLAADNYIKSLLDIIKDTDDTAELIRLKIYGEQPKENKDLDKETENLKQELTVLDYIKLKILSDYLSPRTNLTPQSNILAPEENNNLEDYYNYFNNISNKYFNINNSALGGVVNLDNPIPNYANNPYANIPVVRYADGGKLNKFEEGGDIPIILTTQALPKTFTFDWDEALQENKKKTDNFFKFAMIPLVKAVLDAKTIVSPTLPEVIAHPKYGYYKDKYMRDKKIENAYKVFGRTINNPVFILKIKSLPKDKLIKALMYNKILLDLALKEYERYSTDENRDRLKYIQLKIEQGYYVDPSCINDATNGMFINNIEFMNNPGKYNYALTHRMITDLSNADDLFGGDIIQINNLQGLPHHAGIIRFGEPGTNEPQGTIFRTDSKGNEGIMVVLNHGDTYKDLNRERRGEPIDFSRRDFTTGWPVKLTDGTSYNVFTYIGTPEEQLEIDEKARKTIKKFEDAQKVNLEEWELNHPGFFDAINNLVQEGYISRYLKEHNNNNNPFGF